MNSISICRIFISNELSAEFYDEAGILKGFALLGATLQGQRNQWLEKLNLNKTAA